MPTIASNMTRLVGNTPMVYLNRISEGCHATLAAKLEYMNPFGSLKDRIALSMIEDAESKGLLKEGSVIVEPTSGNTGTALAYICLIKGYKLILTMPKSNQCFRKSLFNFLETEVICTEESEGMEGAVHKAETIVASDPSKYFMPHQFHNPANVGIHRTDTGPEIWHDSDGQVDMVVAGVGTGGSITGISQALKERKPSIHTVAVEPAEAAVLSGERLRGSHQLDGIGAGFIPEILDRNLIDEVIKVPSNIAISHIKALVQSEGIFAGPSSAAVLVAGLQIAKREENKNKLIILIFADGGEKYCNSLFDKEI